MNPTFGVGLTSSFGAAGSRPLSRNYDATTESSRPFDPFSRRSIRFEDSASQITASSSGEDPDLDDLSVFEEEWECTPDKRFPKESRENIRKAIRSEEKKYFYDGTVLIFKAASVLSLLFGLNNIAFGIVSVYGTQNDAAAILTIFSGGCEVLLALIGLASLVDAVMKRVNMYGYATFSGTIVVLVLSAFTVVTSEIELRCSLSQASFRGCYDKEGLEECTEDWASLPDVGTCDELNSCLIRNSCPAADFAATGCAARTTKECDNLFWFSFLQMCLIIFQAVCVFVSMMVVHRRVRLLRKIETIQEFERDLNPLPYALFQREEKLKGRGNTSDFYYEMQTLSNMSRKASTMTVSSASSGPSQVPFRYSVAYNQDTFANLIKNSPNKRQSVIAVPPSPKAATNPSAESNGAGDGEPPTGQPSSTRTSMEGRASLEGTRAQAALPARKRLAGRTPEQMRIDDIDEFWEETDECRSCYCVAVTCAWCPSCCPGTRHAGPMEKARLGIAMFLWPLAISGLGNLYYTYMKRWRFSVYGASNHMESVQQRDDVRIVYGFLKLLGCAIGLFGLAHWKGPYRLFTFKRKSRCLVFFAVSTSIASIFLVFSVVQLIARSVSECSYSQYAFRGCWDGDLACLSTNTCTHDQLAKAGCRAPDMQNCGEVGDEEAFWQYISLGIDLIGNVFVIPEVVKLVEQYDMRLERELELQEELVPDWVPRSWFDTEAFSFPPVSFFIKELREPLVEARIKIAFVIMMSIPAGVSLIYIANVSHYSTMLWGLGICILVSIPLGFLPLYGRISDLEKPITWYRHPYVVLGYAILAGFLYITATMTFLTDAYRAYSRCDMAQGAFNNCWTDPSLLTCLSTDSCTADQLKSTDCMAPTKEQCFGVAPVWLFVLMGTIYSYLATGVGHFAGCYAKELMASGAWRHEQKVGADTPAANTLRLGFNVGALVATILTGIGLPIIFMYLTIRIV